MNADSHNRHQNRRTALAILLLPLLMSAAWSCFAADGQPWAYPYPVPEKGFGIYTWWDDYDAFNSYYYWDEEGRLRRFWSSYDQPDRILYDPAEPEAIDPDHEAILRAHDQDGDGTSDWDEIEAGTGADDPDDHPEPPDPEVYDPNSTTQDNDADGIPNATDPDDDNDGHQDADSDPDADGRNGPDDIEQLIKATTDLGPFELRMITLTDPETGDPLLDQNGNPLQLEERSWPEFSADYQTDSREEIQQNELAQANRHHAEELAASLGGKLTWRLSIESGPNGGSLYYWEFRNPTVGDGQWQLGEQYGIMPMNLPFMANDPDNLTNTNAISVLADPDNDTQSTGRELINGSDPMNGTKIYISTTDSDNDNWSDDEERRYGSNVYDNRSYPRDDADYFVTVTKLHGSPDGSISGPQADYDHDGISDRDELGCGSSPTNLHQKPVDSDSDGRPDYIERMYGSNPHDSGSRPPSSWAPSGVTRYDNDGDGFSNNLEQLQGSDPYDGNSAPADQTPDMDGQGPGTEGNDFDEAEEFEKELSEVNAETDAVEACLDALGLDLDCLRNLDGQDYSLTVRIPIGGTIRNIQWYEFTFELNPDRMQESFAKAILITIRDVIHLFCMFAMGVWFFRSMWAMLWTL